MTLISAKDLDAQMGQGQVPVSGMPVRPGGAEGAMQARFLPQSDQVQVEQGHGRRGSTVVEGGEVPQQGFYGSGTVISLSGAEALPPKFEPKAMPVPPMPLPPVPVAVRPVAPAAPVPALTPSAAALMARLGLKPKAP